jgi:hypothetical protein
MGTEASQLFSFRIWSITGLPSSIRNSREKPQNLHVDLLGDGANVGFGLFGQDDPLHAGF